MNIDEIMEMVMANEDVKNLSHKEKRAARPAFFCAHEASGLRESVTFKKVHAPYNS
jgi:hypothetical protein